MSYGSFSLDELSPRVPDDETMMGATLSDAQAVWWVATENGAKAGGRCISSDGCSGRAS